ncbi:polyamine oxidase [Martiniozyma asiatica (nom. inval.)]|nr:polyamine oxidase [Martiniozyma asiatica]
MASHHTALILGAGISGLAAAQLLEKENIDYRIIEARERVGGRILTDYTGLTPYDLGASWAHDTLSNPLFDEIILDECKNKGKYGMYYDDQHPLFFSKHHGPKDFEANKVEQVVREIEKFIELKYFEEIGKEDLSVKDIVEEYMEKQQALLTEFQKSYAPQLLRGLELWHGIGWDKMSSKFGLVDNVGRNCLFTEGYDVVIREITKTLGAGKIMLKAPVVKIDRKKYQKENKIEVCLKNGNVYTANYVICTVPQSVLQLHNQPEKDGFIRWEPKLPSRIIDSLDNMSWGKLGKVIFEFETPWWSHHDTDRFVAISEPDITGSGVLPPTWSFPVLILNYFKSKNVPSLLCFTQGELTEYIEQNPDKAWEHMHPILERLSLHSKIPAPKRTITTDWTLSPYSSGSYGACAPGNDPTDLVIQLSRGLDNIRFAGEHTILDGSGAVHGAWMSGRREAEVILSKLGIEGYHEEDHVW